MKLNKILIIALILLALICLPISFASDSNADSMANTYLEPQSIDQIDNTNLENDFNQNNLYQNDFNQNSDLNSDESVIDDSIAEDSYSDNSNLNNEHIDNDASVNDRVDHALGDANTIDYNSPNLDTNFTNLNVTFTNDNTIFVNASYDGSVESGTIENPFKTINAAYNEFSKGTNTKTNIFLAKGSYQTTSLMRISKNVNIVGEDTLNTIINGRDTYQIFYISPPASYGAVSPFVNIFNLTFSNGVSYYGGAIYVNESGVNFVNVVFANNTARNYTYYTNVYPGSGGAIYLDKAFVKFYNATFVDNVALGKEDAYAGALFNDMAETTIINSKFINNSVTCPNGAGGAIYDYSGILVLFNSSIANNTVNSNISMGGAITTWATHNAYVLNSTIDGNKLYGEFTFGSAIINKANYLVIANTTISNNLANGSCAVNGTFLNLNGIINCSNLQFKNNIANNPQNLFLCLEDQMILERAFDDSLLTDLPSHYDLRDYGLVTPVKDQGSSGSCWAFSTLAALESYLLKYENFSYDFSENNMKNLMGYYGLNGTDWSDGGNHYMSLAYLLRWNGPINESEDPFDDTSHSSKSNLKPTKLVEDILYLPLRLNYLDINQIKAALMTYGAMYTTIHSDNSFQYNPDYYLDVISVSNHAVTIIGWDDNYSADNFAVRPPGDGAFIIKNSWNTDHGYDGYWYISYYDKSFAGYGLDTISAMAFVTVENTTAFKTNYQYDILGNTFESIGFGCSTAWFANEFTAKNNNPLSAFGLYTYGDSSYLVNITVNGVVKYIQEGLIKGAGYHTVKLDEFVELTKNDIFRIAVKLTTPITIFPVAVESQRSGYSSGADAEEGQSFISPDGIEWYDLADYNQGIKFYQYASDNILEKANVCLKAYATGYADVFLNIKSNASIYYKGDTVEITLTISNEGDAINDINISTTLDRGVSIKSVTYYKGSFNYNSKVWHLDSLGQDESVVLKLKLSLNQIKDIITTSFDFNYAGYIPSNATTSVSIGIYYAGTTSFVQLENITTIAKSQNEVLIKLLDFNSTPLANKNIVVSLLKKEIDGELISLANDFVPVALVTDGEGNAHFILDLNEGNYEFLASFAGDAHLDASNMAFNVSVYRINTEIKILGDYDLSNITTIALSNDELKFYLLDEGQNIIKDKLLRLTDTISGKYYDLISDDEGFYKLNLNLTAGTYGFNLNFSNDEVYGDAELDFIVNALKKESPVISIEKDILSIYDSLKISLKDENGDAMAMKLLKIIISNEWGGKNSILALTDDEGIVEFYNLQPGVYNLSAVFENDDVYNDSLFNSTFKVIRDSTNIAFSNMITTAVDSKNDGRIGEYFIWRLLDGNGNPMANTPMQIGFNGVIYDYEHNGICTDEDGYAQLQINLGYKGDYTFAICFLGDESHNASFAVAKITVNTQTPTLTIPNKSYKATAKTKSLTATFKSNKGSLIANKKVSFTVNGKTYSAKTNDNGVATVNVSLNKKGTYTFTAKFEGDSTYSAVSKTAKLTLK